MSETWIGIIYKFTNKVNGKIYIGQTVNSFKMRYQGDLRKSVTNKKLKDDLINYGLDNFVIEEEFDTASTPEELDKLEMHYISLYEATNPSKGYNKTKGTKREKYYHNEPTVFIDLDAYVTNINTDIYMILRRILLSLQRD